MPQKKAVLFLVLAVTFAVMGAILFSRRAGTVSAVGMAATAVAVVGFVVAAVASRRKLQRDAA
jgi:hypothetical protein